MKSTIYVYVVLVCSVLAADAAVFSSKCARVRCTACHKCEMSTGICVPDPSQQNCGQSASSDDAITACSTVRCSECQTCKQNDAGQAKCVYVSGCCPANQPHVSCFVSSCQSQAPQCPNYANCIAADCGSCQAKFYDKDWSEICVGNSSNSKNNSPAVLTNSCAATLCPVNTTCVEDTNCSQPPCSARCEPFKSCGDITCQADEHCVFNPDIRCIRAPCPQYTCEKIDTSKPCSNETCPSGTRCVPTTLFCKKAPCPQYTCEPVSPCDDVQCATGQICQPDIKQCFTTPCPQYKCVADPCATARCAGRCVAENGQAKCVSDNLNDPCHNVQCPAAQICQPDIKQCFTTPCPQYKCVADPCATARCAGKCVAENGQAKCVNDNLNDPCHDVQCPAAQICQPAIKQCFTTPCPQYQCVADPCATVRCAGKCVAENGQAKCVSDNLNDPCHNVQCPAAQICQPDIKQCFTTPCPQYKCVADPCATARCAGKCVAENGQAKCVNDNLNDPCHDVQCPAAQICQPAIKQCFTTPCPQYQCVADPCATVRCAGKCVAENGQAKCIDGADQPTNLVRCSQLPDQGNKCKAAMQRWHFSRQSNSCEQFTYGGCDGNENNFLSESDCKTTCQNLPQCPIADILIKEGCRIDGDVLNNNTLCPMPNIVCDSAVNDCALVDCMTGHICQMKNGQAACVAIVDDKTKQCSQLPDAGMCEAAMPRFYFSRTSNQCLNFTYGGCGGNSNKFDTIEQCMERCKDTPPCPMYSMMAPPAGCEYVGTELNDGLCPKPKLVCNDTSECAKAKCPAGQVCVPSPKACFTTPCPQYDCVENPCNLVDCQSGKHCTVTSGKAQCVDSNIGGDDEHLKICSQMPDPGPCDNTGTTRWYYNRQVSKCEQFMYNGCEGNGNRFETQEECNNKCTNIRPCPMAMPGIPPAGCHFDRMELNDALCPMPKLVCNDSSECATANCPAGQVCVPSPKACFTTPCPQYDCVENPCNLVDCKTDHLCQLQNGQATCVPNLDDKTKQCSQEPVTGTCLALFPRFYYSRTTNECLNFTYGGCGGNSNNFETIEQCMERCKDTPPCPIYTMMAPPAGCEYFGTGMDEKLCPRPKLVCNDTSECATAKCPAGQVCVPSPKACFTKPCPQYDCVENPCNLVDCQSGKHCTVTSGKAQCVENNNNIELSSCAAILCAPDTVCQTVNGRGMCVDKTVSDNRTLTCSALLEDNNNAPNVAICAGNKQSWRYNRFSSSCEQVTWSGCGKNDNIFATQDECNQRCAGVEPCPQIKPAPLTPGCEYHGSHLNQFLCPEPTLICSVTTGCEAMFCTADSTCQVINGHAQCVSLDAGDSNTVACSGLVEENTCAALPKWRYNRQSSACESITWTGCSSNQNLFNSKEECDQKCSKVPPCPMLKPAPAPAGCEYNGTELNQRLCPVPKLVCNDNANCAAVTCLAGDECKTIDGVARCVKSNDGQLQTCSQLPEMGPCQAFMPRWYYNRQTSNCQRFNYSGCEGNENNFASIEDCEQRCIGVRPCPIIDPMAPPTGCRYEDKRLDEQLLCPVPKLVCDEKAACAAVTCSSDQKCVILTSGPKCVPKSPANCTVNVTVGSTCPANSPRPYYFNAQSGKCEQSIWKECEGENLFATIKLCERQCIEQRPCYPPPVAAPPAGCNYEISNDSEGCPTVFNLRCPNGQAPVS